MAGNGAGLAGERSEAFWGFHRVVESLKREGRAPRALVLENVVGALTSNGGRDFREICRALHLLGYFFGALTMDASHFVPQSRPRLFFVAVRKCLIQKSPCRAAIGDFRASSARVPKCTLRSGSRNRYFRLGLALFDSDTKDQSYPTELCRAVPSSIWSSLALRRAEEQLPPDLRKAWRWWDVPLPPRSNISFIDLIEDEPIGVEWHSREETDRFLSMMSVSNRAKVEEARCSGKRVAGTIYRRTRIDADGKKVQRAEVRFDGMAGCLRTPGGGSSRQFVMIVDRDMVRTRLLSPREAARLMGLPEDYDLPKNYNDAYHLLGDGLAVPVVRHLAEGLLAKILLESPVSSIAAE